MLRSIKVANFRGFESFTAELRQTTAMIGRNSSGKSSLLHAVRLSTDVLQLALDDPDEKPGIRDGLITVARDFVVPDASSLVHLADWRQLFHHGEPSEGSWIEIALEFDASDPLQRLETTLRFGRNSQMKLQVQARSRAVERRIANVALTSRNRPGMVRDALREAAPQVLFLPAFYGVAPHEEYRTLAVVRQLLGTGDQSHIVRNLVARLDDDGLKRLNLFLRDLDIGAVIERTPVPTEQVRELVIRYRDASNGRLELSTAGTGLVSLVALYAALEGLRSDPGIAQDRLLIGLLDEPEAHLHPSLQGAAAEALAQIVRQFGVQLLVATHSVEMTNRLWRGGTASVLLIDRRQRSGVRLDQESDLLDRLSEFCDLSPFAAINFLASRRILFHEGPDDLELLEFCARVLYRADPQRLARWTQSVKVEFTGASKAPSVDLLARVIQPSIFPRLQASTRVRVGVVIDRDYEREPEEASHRPFGTNLDVVRVVWSRHSIESLFVQRDPLVEGLVAALGLDESEALRFVSIALDAADRDRDLRDAATDGRKAFHRRRDDDGKSFTEDQAMKRARADVDAAPAVWHRGHDRERFVLSHVRGQLPANKRARLAGKVLKLLEAAGHERVSPNRAVPDEVRRFLDVFTDPDEPASAANSTRGASTRSRG